jgi:superfamily I DNA and/or RNA helicase/very-short-patch-repair endonuclease
VITPEQILTAALAAWRTALVNLDARNPLLYFKSTTTMKGVVRPKKGLVDFRINVPDESRLAGLLSGKTTSTSDLHPETYKTREQVAEIPESVEEVEANEKTKKTTAWAKLLTSYEEIVRKARENFEERNIETLHLARGFVSWKQEGPGPSEPLAPLILIPLKIQSKGRGHTDFEITSNGEPIFNDALRLYLQTQRSIDLEELGITDKTKFSSGADIKKYFAPLAKALPGGQIEDIQLIGNFSFFKLPLVADMDRIIEQQIPHPILRATFEDESEIERINELSPKDEFLVFPTDRSQHLAVSAITRGKTIVIQGPPGTGKSQTIANAIAELSAMGKKTLFVAEKRAAIEAVVSRLTDKGLSSLVLDLHSEPDKKRIASQLLEVLYETSHKNGGARNNDSELRTSKEKLQKRWEALNSGSGINLKHEEELSVYEALQTLGKLVANLPEEVDWPREIDRKLLLDLPNAAVITVRERLNTLSELKWLDGDSQHIGRGLLHFVTNQDQVLELSVAIEMLQENALKDFEKEKNKFANDNGYLISTFGECLETMEAAKAIETKQVNWNIADFTSTLRELNHIWTYADLHDLVGYGNPIKAFLESRTRTRRLFAAYRGVAKPTRARLKNEIRDLTSALAIHRKHSGDGTTHPTVPSDFLEMIALEVSTGLDTISPYGPLVAELSVLDFDSLYSRIEMLYSDLALIRELPTVHISRKGILDLGDVPERLLNWLEDDQPDLEKAGEWFARWWIELMLAKTIQAKNLELRISEPGALDRVLHHYQDLDDNHIANNAGRTHDRVRARVMEISNTAGFTKLRRQADKKSAHATFKKLMEEARTEVQTLKPCFAMSPISVSRLLPCEYGIFDVVIFDEASQISPEDSIPSIYRGKQVVVAGDRFQLGPTAKGKSNDDGDEYLDEEGEVELATRGLESILDSLRGVLPISSTYPLQTHYRSQDERLITFSNRAFYIPNNQALISFPSREANPRKALGYVYVEGVQTKSMGKESNTKEIQAVIEQVLDHTTNRFGDSLGIIAFGDDHKRRIEDALLKLERENDSYFDFVGRFSSSREPLFVKSIERVQGDERDCIILSPGYARGDKGTLEHHFGSLGMTGGERRLNVAASRAKKKLTLVTSITAEDFSGYRGQMRGVQLFKAMLQYMESRGLSSDLGDLPPAPENPFEEQIFQVLTKQGLKIDCQVGDSGYRIDFAVRHPSKDDEYLLAIEADGASYHSSDYARERDIVRQRVLESRGWKFARIWSTDWFRNRGGEVEKIMEAYRNALANSSTPSPMTQTVSSSKRTIDKEATPIDEKLFKGLKQSKGHLTQDAMLVEWMQLCGHSRKTKKILERFDALWRGTSTAPPISSNRRDRSLSAPLSVDNYRRVAWVRKDEVEACLRSLESEEDQEISATNRFAKGLISFRKEAPERVGAAFCTIQRESLGRTVEVVILSDFEIRTAHEVFRTGNGIHAVSPDKMDNIFVEFVAPNTEMNLPEDTVRINRKQ